MLCFTTCTAPLASARLGLGRAQPTRVDSEVSEQLRGESERQLNMYSIPMVTDSSLTSFKLSLLISYIFDYPAYTMRHLTSCPFDIPPHIQLLTCLTASEWRLSIYFHSHRVLELIPLFLLDCPPISDLSGHLQILQFCVKRLDSPYSTPDESRAICMIFLVSRIRHIPRRLGETQIELCSCLKISTPFFSKFLRIVLCHFGITREGLRVKFTVRTVFPQVTMVHGHSNNPLATHP
jgi:hypothetical protein